MKEEVKQQKPDSLIFDMDGTLWDAVDTYALAWNEGLKARNINKSISRQALMEVMGWERKQALAQLLPDMSEADREESYKSIVCIQDELIATMGGILYPGVLEGMQALAGQYRLFVVSNCPKYTIARFLQWSGLAPFVVDEMAHGLNNMPKHHNIKLLIEKHRLQQPFYIGDTASDGEQSNMAGIPFVWVSYGFGTASRFHLRFDDFVSLTQHFQSLGRQGTKAIQQTTTNQ